MDACPQLNCITPLRLLLAKELSPERWESEVKLMEAHNEERRKTPIWENNQINVVEYLRSACKLANGYDVIYCFALGPSHNTKMVETTFSFFLMQIPLTLYQTIRSLIIRHNRVLAFCLDAKRAASALGLTGSKEKTGSCPNKMLAL
jgi:hypothetical protein